MIMVMVNSICSRDAAHPLGLRYFGRDVERSAAAKISSLNLILIAAGYAGAYNIRCY